METKPLSLNELEDATYSLKSNKSPGYDNIGYNVIKKCFASLCEPLENICLISQFNWKGCFSRRLKNSRGHTNL